MPHTPGPWTVFFSEAFSPGIEADRLSIVVYGGEYEASGVHGDTQEEALANAQLIAAAPELLSVWYEYPEDVQNEIPPLLVDAPRCAARLLASPDDLEDLRRDDPESLSRLIDELEQLTKQAKAAIAKAEAGS